MELASIFFCEIKASKPKFLYPKSIAEPRKNLDSSTEV